MVFSKYLSLVSSNLWSNNNNRIEEAKAETHPTFKVAYFPRVAFPGRTAAIDGGFFRDRAFANVEELTLKSRLPSFEAIEKSIRGFGPHKYLSKVAVRGTKIAFVRP